MTGEDLEEMVKKYKKQKIIINWFFPCVSLTDIINFFLPLWL